MSHIHIPDGVLPLWLWVSGFIIIFVYLFIIGYQFKTKPFSKNIPLVGVFAALMLIAMSIEIVPIGYHLNLAVLSGIILGPLYSVLSILIVILISALVGHGGITVVGLNTIVIAIEAVLGFYLFTLFRKKINIFASAFIATILALFVSSWATIGIVYLGTNSINDLIEHSSRESGSIVNFHMFESHEHHEEHMHEESHESESQTPAEEDKEQFDIGRFILLVMTLGVIGWLLEAFITAFITNYIVKIKPDLLENDK